MKSTRILAVAMTLALQNATVFAQDSSKVREMSKEQHREMMPMHQKMQEEQKLQDAEIDKLVVEMNTATGEKRMDAIVAVVNKLIEQRKAMHEKMAALLDK
jgi:hypothetical protein